MEKNEIFKSEQRQEPKPAKKGGQGKDTLMIVGAMCCILSSVLMDLAEGIAIPLALVGIPLAIVGLVRHFRNHRNKTRGSDSKQEP